MTKIAEPVIDVNEISHIASGVLIKGDITCPADVRIDGKIDGKIQSSGRVVVGETAEIKGTILCDMLDFWGNMDGDIFVRNTLSLKAGSTVKGNINIHKLQVEMGATLDGFCKMISEEDFDKLVVPQN